MTQGERIVAYIKEFGSISPMEAFNALGITKLATRVGELSREGVKFKKHMIESQNRYGDKVRFMRYWLAEGEK